MKNTTRRGEKGFTLIELTVVMLIVAILTQFSVPLYRGHVRRAMAVEGVVLCSAVASAEKLHLAEKGTYCAAPEGTVSHGLLGVNAVQNRYFRSFGVRVSGTNPSGASFVVSARGSGDASGIVVTFEQHPDQPAVIGTDGV